MSFDVRARGTPVVVVGGGGHAKVVFSILARLNEYAILGYVDRQDQGRILGHAWLGPDTSVQQLAASHHRLAAVLGIGKVDGGKNRLPLMDAIRSAGCALPVVVAPTAFVAQDVELGEGTLVCDGAIVQAGTRAGRAVIVNTGASVDHDCALDDDVHVGPGAVLSGGVQVGTGTLIGVGACCKHYVRVGSKCTIGAGAAVTRDCSDGGLYIGVPARLASP